jgi:hypothetical protein
MSKNSTLQNYDCLKSYIQFMEGRGKRSQKPVRREKFIKTANHPALRYSDEDQG